MKVILFALSLGLSLAAIACSETAGGGNGLAPGTLISAEEIAPFRPGMKVWRVLYASEAIDGRAIEVSGIVAAPSEPRPDGGRDVITFGHGAVGLFDPCALTADLDDVFFTLTTPVLTGAGYVVAVTDYEGLGTPGLHPLGVGESEARGVLDIVRAARQIDEANAAARTVVWGISQGGHAALFAGEIAPEWTSEIEVLGIVAAAPASELEARIGHMAETPDLRGYVWQSTLSFEDTYPNLDTKDVYDAETLGTIGALVGQDACREAFREAARNVENAGLLTDLLDLPPWRPGAQCSPKTPRATRQPRCRSSSCRALPIQTLRFGFPTCCSIDSARPAARQTIECTRVSVTSRSSTATS